MWIQPSFRLEKRASLTPRQRNLPSGGVAQEVGWMAISVAELQACGLVYSSARSEALVSAARSSTGRTTLSIHAT